jgi:hypothetical protein
LSIVCTNPSQSVWLARADIFKSKFTRPILKFLKMAPVYRMRDGKDSLANNEQIFNLVTQILENKDSVCLFPEAAHSGRRQMLPHKKAIPRIALDAEAKNKFALDLQIVPVGIFYSHYWKFDRNLIVQYGKPIDVAKYKVEYHRNPQKTMLILRDEIHEKLSPLTMQINSEAYYQDYENMRQIAGRAYSKNHHFSKDPILQLFHAENDLIKKLENIESNHPELFKQFLAKTREYMDSLAHGNLTDEKVVTFSKARWTIFFAHLCISLLTLPIFIAGFIFNALPFFVPRKFLRKRIKDRAFTSTFFFASGLLIFPLIYLIEAGLLLGLTKSWIISVSALILMPFVGKLAFKLMEFYDRVIEEIKFLTGTKSLRNEMKKLTKQRTELIDLLIR